MTHQPLRVRTVSIERLVPDPANVRTHSKKNLDAIRNSLDKFGQRKPIVVARGTDGSLVVMAGNGTLEAAKELGWTELAVAEVPTDWDADKARAYAIADNRSAELADWDQVGLASALVELDAVGWDIGVLGFEPLQPPIDPDIVDEVPEPPLEPLSKVGDVWQLGRHRVMCGDSTNMQHVATLVNGQTAPLLHADPPYGMGKQSDGVLNDNIYREQLDAFQMLWWKTWRKHLTDNASAYIWGNPEDLWRLWFCGGLRESEQIEMRNEIVWAKPSGFGQSSELNTKYSVNTERALFFQLGQQFLGNVNKDDFPEAWADTLNYFRGEADSVGLTQKDVKRLCGVQMYGHWFTRVQFAFMPEKYYAILQAEYPDAFRRDWKELKREWDRVKLIPRQAVQGGRSYFDNVHDNFNEVWQFTKVSGDERHGHATPKPVEMVARALKSSAPENGLVLEPFGGSGSTLIAAEVTDRICYTMELEPKYVDVIVRRWENLTGKKATLVDD